MTNAVNPPCVRCLKPVIAKPGAKPALYCSKKCRKASFGVAHFQTDFMHRKRARLLGLPFVRINRDIVFKACQWRCQLCGIVTPAEFIGRDPEPRRPTLDHITPMSRGGGHVWSNVWLLCQSCDARKRDSELDLNAAAKADRYTALMERTLPKQETMVAAMLNSGLLDWWPWLSSPVPVSPKP